MNRKWGKQNIRESIKKRLIMRMGQNKQTRKNEVGENRRIL